MRSSSIMLPLLGGAMLGLVCGLLGQRWLSRDSLSIGGSPEPPYHADPAAGSRSRSTTGSGAGHDESVSSDTAPTSLQGWLSLIEPLDTEGTAERLAAALESVDLEALERLCNEANTALGQNDVAYAHLSMALAKRANEIDRLAFLDRAFSESGWLWESMRKSLVLEHAKTDFVAAATVLDRPLGGNERTEMWAMLAAAKTGRSFEATWDALREAFGRHATPKEQAKGLEQTLDNRGLSQLAFRFPQEMKAWLKEKKASLGFALSEEERRWWTFAGYSIDSGAAGALRADADGSAGIFQRVFPTPADEFRQWREGVVTLSSINAHTATSFARHWAETDPRAGAEWLLTLDEDVAASARHEVLSLWADRDPTAAMGWLLSHPALPVTTSTAMALSRALAAVDPTQVPRLLERLDPEMRTEALLWAAPQIARLDPALATSAVLALPHAAAQASALNAIAETVAVRGANEGLVWVRSLPDPLQSAALGSLVATLTVQEPALAAEAVSAWTEAGGTVDELGVVAVAKDWATGAPEEAAAWADALAPGKAQDHATRAVAVTWAALDAEAARGWIDSLPDSQVKYDCQQLVQVK